LDFVQTFRTFISFSNFPVEDSSSSTAIPWHASALRLESNLVEGCIAVAVGGFAHEEHCNCVRFGGERRLCSKEKRVFYGGGGGGVAVVAIISECRWIS
jgi:hypothetical protein